MQTEYVRSLHNNYERILLEQKPEENRYQYCIMSRGGIKGLLPFSLRYIDDKAYLYYDITSKQSISQLFGEKHIERQWFLDFMWSMKQISTELNRFLLQDRNLVWAPQHIYQDLEKTIFYYLYVPYYNEENEFGKLLEFLVERVDYEDEKLVDCIYKVYEQYEQKKEIYLQQQIFEDVNNTFLNDEEDENEDPIVKGVQDVEPENSVIKDAAENVTSDEADEKKKSNKKGIFAFLENRKRKVLEEKKKAETYEEAMQRMMKGTLVAEENRYYKSAEDFQKIQTGYSKTEAEYENEEYEGVEYGNTIYIEEKKSDIPKQRKLWTPDGKILATLQGKICTIGKKKDEVTLWLEDISVSRIHARIVEEDNKVYIEDLNSTNGTYKNGLRLQPYERRVLEEGDEIKCGKKIMIFR